MRSAQAGSPGGDHQPRLEPVTARLHAPALCRQVLVSLNLRIGKAGFVILVAPCRLRHHGPIHGKLLPLPALLTINVKPPNHVHDPHPPAIDCSLTRRPENECQHLYRCFRDPHCFSGCDKRQSFPSSDLPQPTKRPDCQFTRQWTPTLPASVGVNSEAIST